MKKKKKKPIRLLSRATTKENFQMIAIFLTMKIKMEMYQPMICIESDNKEKFVKFEKKCAFLKKQKCVRKYNN